MWVVGVKGKNVRLGLTAPADVAVHRAEVWHRMSWAHSPAPKPHESSCARSA
ncbi:MAG: carbon storage regulator [Planctomycetes bacterium]|nr:carbon storage regulator [Planctomycetota bacterium]